MPQRKKTSSSAQSPDFPPASPPPKYEREVIEVPDTPGRAEKLKEYARSLQTSATGADINGIKTELEAIKTLTDQMQDTQDERFRIIANEIKVVLEKISKLDKRVSNMFYVFKTIQATATPPQHSSTSKTTPHVHSNVNPPKPCIFCRGIGSSICHSSFFNFFCHYHLNLSLYVCVKRLCTCPTSAFHDGGATVSNCPRSSRADTSDAQGSTLNTNDVRALNASGESRAIGSCAPVSEYARQLCSRCASRRPPEIHWTIRCRARLIMCLRPGPDG